MAHSRNYDSRNEEYEIRYSWTIENFRFLFSSETVWCSIFPAKQLNDPEWQVELDFPVLELDNFSGVLRQTPSSNVKLARLFVLVSVEDDNGSRIILQQLFKNVYPTNEIIFNSEIIRNISYPYDSFRLSICMGLKNVTPALSIENIICTVVEVETFRTIVAVKPSELRENSKLDLLLFKPVNFPELPELKFRIMLTGGQNVYLEMLKIGSMTADIIVYCKVSVLNFNNSTVNCFTEKWFKYKFDRSDNVRHIKNIMAYELFKQYIPSNNLNLLLELTLSTSKNFNLIEVKSFRVGQEDIIFGKNPVSCEHSLERNDISESSNDAENLVNTTVPIPANEVSSLREYSKSMEKDVTVKLDVEFYTKSIEVEEHTLVNDILLVYNEKKYSDLKICVGDQSFYVHKTILQARSSVFATMLENDMKEKQSGIVEIKDTTPETINSFLNFVYSDKLPADLDYDSYIELYAVADKYEVMLLKQKCSKVLKSKISLTTVCDLLVLADLHGDVALKEVAMDFLKKNSAKVFATEQFKSFMLNNVQLAADTMHSIYSA